MRSGSPGVLLRGGERALLAPAPFPAPGPPRGSARQGALPLERAAAGRPPWEARAGLGFATGDASWRGNLLGAAWRAPSPAAPPRPSMLSRARGLRAAGRELLAPREPGKGRRRRRRRRGGLLPVPQREPLVRAAGRARNRRSLARTACSPAEAPGGAWRRRQRPCAHPCPPPPPPWIPFEGRDLEPPPAGLEPRTVLLLQTSRRLCLPGGRRKRKPPPRSAAPAAKERPTEHDSRAAGGAGAGPAVSGRAPRARLRAPRAQHPERHGEWRRRRGTAAGQPGAAVVPQGPQPGGGRRAAGQSGQGRQLPGARQRERGRRLRPLRPVSGSRGRAGGRGRKCRCGGLGRERALPRPSPTFRLPREVSAPLDGVPLLSSPAAVGQGRAEAPPRIPPSASPESQAGAPRPREAAWQAVGGALRSRDPVGGKPRPPFLSAFWQPNPRPAYSRGGRLGLRGICPQVGVRVERLVWAPLLSGRGSVSSLA